MLSVKSLLAFATCLMLSVCSLRYCVTIGIWMQQALFTKSKYPYTPFSCNNNKSNVSLFCSAMFNVICSCIFSFSSMTQIAVASAAICLVRLHNILWFWNAVAWGVKIDSRARLTTVPVLGYWQGSFDYLLVCLHGAGARYCSLQRWQSVNVSSMCWHHWPLTGKSVVRVPSLLHAVSPIEGSVSSEQIISDQVSLLVKWDQVSLIGVVQLQQMQHIWKTWATRHNLWIPASQLLQL